ncbi:MAG: adenylate/guanylate cyclase domain-containing protein [Treponema sp.]|nr:adenylate/guanylate cyclase domain-containing protein [Treponema sp.]
MNLIKKNKLAVCIVLLSAFFTLFAKLNLFDTVEYRAFDFELKMQESPAEDDSIVFVEVDDDSLSYIGSWPWQRNILSEVLFRLKEFGAKTAVFDIEYVSPSSLAVDEDLTEIVDEEFNRLESGVIENVGAIPEAVRSVKPAELSDEITNVLLNDYVYESKKRITQGMKLNYDDEFAKSIQFFDNAFLTVNLRNIGIETPEEDVEYVRTRFLFPNVIDENGMIKKYNEIVLKEESGSSEKGFVPALHSISSHAKGLGFTNVVVDRDGVRRRVELLNDLDGTFALQLAFSPFVRNSGVTKIERKPSSLVLYDVKFPGKEPSNMEIPLDRNGCMILNWSHNTYNNSFSHIPVYYIYDFYNAEYRISKDLKKIVAQMNSFSPEESAAIETLSSVHSALEKLKSLLLIKCAGFDSANVPLKKGRRGGGLTEEDYEKYFSERAAFFDSALKTAEYFKTVPAFENEDIAAFCSHVESYCSSYSALKTQLEGKFCFIGNSATSSTDLGATPYEKRYANLGTHANVLNTILSGKFISEYSVFIGFGIVLLCIFVVLYLSRNKSHGRKNIFALLFVIIPALTLASLMIFFRIYIPILLPVLYSVLIYICNFGINFAAVNGDKKFLTTTFGSYVAPAVVDQIIKNPDVARLGGKSEELTALFSDVKTFSGFTEVINNEEMKNAVEENNALPEDQRKSRAEVEALGASRGAERLVRILNQYLGALSDAIMDNKGTIDKYVGDEIVSFFGAPIPDKNNAFNACVAAVRMLEAEKKFNTENADVLPVNPKTGEKFFLHSRVGINTGNMVVC